MRPLTHRVWQEHFTVLRPYVLEEFPDVDSSELDGVRDDWNGLVALVHRATGLPAGEVESRLQTLDVDELGLGTGEDAGQAGQTDEAGNEASLAQLRLGAGFSEDERDRIVARLSKLNRRLKRFPADGTDMELSVKDRDSNAQKVTLEVWLPNFPRVVSTSKESDLRAALMDVREDTWRQIDDAVNRRKA